MTKSRIKIISIVLLITLIIVINSSRNVTADIEPDIIGSVGLQTTDEINTYLAHVNVSIELFDNVARCKGNYTLNNPSEINESFSLIFDPGNKPNNITISIGNDSTNYTEKIIDEFNNSLDKRDVVTFSVEIESNNSLSILIEWEMVTIREWSHIIFLGIPIGKRDHISWDTSYLIIGMRSWNRPIESVDLIINIKTTQFEDYELKFRYNDDYRNQGNLMPTNISKNELDYNRIYFHFEDFSEGSLLITINGERVDETTWHPFSIGILIIAIVLFLVMLKILKNKSIINK